ncbi:14295_t:CDS:2 [Ambispora leptoticha]|uniref:14295_t:CDS:1 n=1 Tax=Ambispora leptoticha TaxID=144679 RepID=A0A9N9GD39_9GLOM|nr:14295_t:CDS:2 [Ambispora leptoticha]
MCIPGRREKTPNNWILGITEIGSGYDFVNGKYASSESCTENLFDWSKEPVQEIKLHGKTYCYPKGIIDWLAKLWKNIRSHSLALLQQEAREFFGFSGSVKFEYGDVVNYSKFHSFSRVQYEYKSYHLHLTSNIAVLRRLLKPEIRDEIDNSQIEPKVIFKKYGTHFIHSLQMGVLTGSTNKLKFNSKNHLSRMIKWAFMSFASGSGSDDQQEEIKGFVASSEFRMQARGGNVEVLGYDYQHMNLNAWAATVIDEPVFMAFDNPYSLTFIGDLACTEKRQNQFANAWSLFAQSQKTSFPSFDPPYLEYARIRVEDSSDYNQSFVCKPMQFEGSKWQIFKKWLAQSLDRYGYGIIVREKLFAEGLLREVTDAKSLREQTLYNIDNNSQSYYSWIPLTDEPDNFVALGSFLHNLRNYEYALAQNNGLVGVHRSVCISGVRGSYVSADVWRIAPQDDAIDIGAFVVHDSSKPQLPIWLLRKDVAELVEYLN